MKKVFTDLIDSALINEETRTEISEAWEAKLVEAREQVRAELREEFAQRYEHDKSVMVVALDKMVNDTLTAEISQIAEEKKAINEDRVKFQTKMNESATKFNSFMVTKLAEEIGELRKDRKVHTEGVAKLEKFIVNALAREISEFAQDKRDLVETKVRLVSGARSKLESLKAQFVKESANKMSKAVSKHLKAELKQLHEDVKVARENSFGRRIFEAYAAEFGATHLNEKAEVRKLQKTIADKDKQLGEAITLTRKAKTLVESKEREMRILKESNERDSTLEDLLAPLNKDKREVMRNLLESVQTARLKNAFEKYLPAVLEDRTSKASKVIVESVSEITGDKSARQPDEDRTNVIDLVRLAGVGVK